MRGWEEGEMKGPGPLGGESAVIGGRVSTLGEGGKES